MTRRDDRYYEAIAEGVYRAMWQMITNNTSSPCADFFFHIERAAETAFRDIAEKHDREQDDKGGNHGN